MPYVKQKKIPERKKQSAKSALLIMCEQDPDTAYELGIWSDGRHLDPEQENEPEYLPD